MLVSIVAVSILLFIANYNNMPTIDSSYNFCRPTKSTWGVSILHFALSYLYFHLVKLIKILFTSIIASFNNNNSIHLWNDKIRKRKLKYFIYI
jgi:hypothetical protein